MTKGDKTRQFIVEQTASVFNKQGYAGTSLTDMTNATGLTKGSIYGNFANKDEVALAAFDHNLKKVQKVYGDEMSKHTTAEDKLFTYMNVYEQFMKFPFPDGGCPILNTAIEADDTHPVLKKKVADAIVQWKDTIVGLIELGVKNGEFTNVQHAEQTAITMIAMLEGSIMIAKATGKINYQHQVIASMKQLIRGLR